MLIQQQNFHSCAFLEEKLWVIDFFAFYNTNVGLLEFFMNPQVAKPFPVIAIKRHFVFPCFGNVFVETEDVFPQGLQITFYGFILFKEVVVDFAEHA